MSLSDVIDPQDPWARQVAVRVHFEIERWVKEELHDQIVEFNALPPELLSFPLLDTTETMLGVTCMLQEGWHSGALISFWANSNRDWAPAGRVAISEDHDAVVIDIRMTAGVGRLSPDWVGLFIKAPFERVKSIAASVDGNIDISSTRLVSLEGAPLTFQISDVVLGNELTGDVDVDVAAIVAFIFPKVRDFLTYKCLEGLLEQWCERENQKLMAQLALAENNDLSFRHFELRVNRKMVRLP